MKIKEDTYVPVHHSIFVSDLYMGLRPQEKEKREGRS